MPLIYVHFVLQCLIVSFVFSSFFCLSISSFTTFQRSCVLVSREDRYFMSLGNIYYFQVFINVAFCSITYLMSMYVHEFVSVVSWCCGVMCPSTAFSVSILAFELEKYLISKDRNRLIVSRTQCPSFQCFLNVVDIRWTLKQCCVLTGLLK